MSIDKATPMEWDKVAGKHFYGADDVVNKPHHYNTGAIECIEAIQESMEPEQFKGYLKGNVMKYVWRYEYKNGVEDLRKARWYLEQLIEANR